MSEMKEGLEGVVAFRTTIAEPDREGGALRYRGVDIEELVGHVPFEQVWGLLVDGALEPGLPSAEPYEAKNLTGDAPADLQAVTAALGGEWRLDKLIDITDAEATEDLRRLSATMISVVAQSARVADGHTRPVDRATVDRGASTAERFLLEWRGEADPKDVGAIETYWICTAEHGLNASTFTARVVASTGADCAASLSAAVGALSGPLHGGAPARVLPMLDAVAEQGDAEAWVKDALDRRERIMGFGHRIYRAEDPRARLLRRTAQGARSASLRGRRGARAGRARRAPREATRPRARDERRVLVRGRARRRRHPAGARAGHVRLFADGRLVGAHPRAEAARKARPPVGRIRRPGAALARRAMTDLASYRDRFPILADTTYLINHSLGAMPAAAEDRLAEYARTWKTRGVRAWGEGWWTMPMVVGDQIGRIVGAPAGSTVMHQNVAVAEAIVRSCFRPEGGRNRVVYEEANFPSVRYLWQAQPDLEVVVVR